MSGKEAVVIEPHNDDLIIGIGGTILQLLANGWDVTSIVLCDGRYGNDANHTPEETVSIRAAEKRAEKEFLGIESTNLGVEDLHLSDQFEDPERREDILSRLRGLCPDSDEFVLFLPAGSEAHPDHQGAHSFVRELVEESDADITEVHYVVWEVPFYPHGVEQSGTVVAVDVGEEYGEKLAGIELHESQEQKQAYTNMVTKFNQYLAELYGSQENYVELVSVRGDDEQLTADLRCNDVTSRYHPA